MNRRRKISLFARTFARVQDFFNKHKIPIAEYLAVMEDFDVARKRSIAIDQCGWCQRHVNCEELNDTELEEYFSTAICPKCVVQTDKPTILEPEIH